MKTSGPIKRGETWLGIHLTELRRGSHRVEILGFQLAPDLVEKMPKKVASPEKLHQGIFQLVKQMDVFW